MFEDERSRIVDKVMILTFERLKSGVYFDTSLKPYRKEFLERLLNYFEDREKYEECVVIREVIKKRFNHEDENNYRKF